MLYCRHDGPGKIHRLAEGLSPEGLHEIEEILEALMGNDGEADFIPGQLAELDRRVADPNPRYADPEEVEAIFRRYGVG